MNVNRYRVKMEARVQIRSTLMHVPACQDIQENYVKQARINC